MVRIFSLELKFSGVNLENINTGNYSVMTSLIMLSVDCVLYWILTWYFTNVFPGEYGIPKKFYFPFTKNYWTNLFSSKVKRDKKRPPIILMDDEEEAQMELAAKMHEWDAYESDESTFQPLSEEMLQKRTVVIRDLKKQFDSNGNQTVAVDGLSLDFVEGELFGFLGSNGAGINSLQSCVSSQYITPFNILEIPCIHLPGTF
jgi:hypothetical protein